MSGFSSHAKANAQNRALQKAVREKYGHRIQISTSDNNSLVRFKLSKLSLEQADYTRIKRLLIKGIIGVVLVALFSYYVFTWINANVYA